MVCQSSSSPLTHQKITWDLLKTLQYEAVLNILPVLYFISCPTIIMAMDLQDCYFNIWFAGGNYEKKTKPTDARLITPTLASVRLNQKVWILDKQGGGK